MLQIDFQEARSETSKKREERKFSQCEIESETRIHIHSCDTYLLVDDSSEDSSPYDDDDIDADDTDDNDDDDFSEQAETSSRDQDQGQGQGHQDHEKIRRPAPPEPFTLTEANFCVIVCARHFGALKLHFGHFPEPPVTGTGVVGIKSRLYK